MAHPRSFFWYDLMSADRARAEAFYGAVVGWDRDSLPMEGGGTYTILKAGEHGVAGIMDMPPEVRAAGGDARWQGYVYASDVDAKAEEIRQAGGAVHRAPADIPGVGRFAVVSDPQGAAFLVMSPQGDRPPLPADLPGRIGWHELHAQDGASAFAFYAARFGWTKAEAIDMGPMGVYQLFAADGVPVGGMMTRPPGSPLAGWLFYFAVPEADAAAARVVEYGGTILMGVHEVPGGNWIVQARDPEGVVFALVAPKR